MIKINYPGSVVHNVGFDWSIEGATPGATWTATVVKEGAVHSSANGIIPAGGSAKQYGTALELGQYQIEFTFSTGEFFRVEVESFTEPTFIWQPDWSVQMEHQPQLRTIKFGDGYGQEYPAGINNDPVRMSLNFSALRDIEAVQIMLFLRSMGGYKSFWWTDVNGRKLRYKCKSYARTPARVDDNSVSASFEQAFI